MLVTPLDRPFEWTNPPRLALGLCLVLLLIFVPWHMADHSLKQELAKEYRANLFRTEWPLYETHAMRTGQSVMLKKLKADYDAALEDPARLDAVALYVAMDDEFVAAVKKQGHDYMDAEAYDRWVAARKAFDPQRSKLSARALGVDPTKGLRPITFLTFGLVQPDAVQLLAALLLLLTLGIAVELAAGSGPLLAGFLGGGVVGAVAYLIGNGTDVLPLTGASVGTAAVAGMFFMHFKAGKVRVLGKEIPAYSLAVLWLLVTAAEYFLSPLRGCELAARIAALASGPFWAFAYAKWFATAADYLPVITSDAPEDDSQTAYREQLNQALEAVARLEFAAAQKVLREMVKHYPSDPRVLTQLYYLEKLTPGSPAFEAVSRRLFGFGAGDSDALVLRLYRDYIRYSPEKTALDLETGLKLVIRFTRMNEVLEADKLMRVVLEKQQPHPLIAKTASALADALERLREPARARFFRQAAAG